MDLKTRYLGLDLPSPIVAAASPLTGEVDNIRRLEDLGAGAVVLPSLFEEEIEQDEQAIERLSTAGIESYPEALTYFPAAASCRIGSERYQELVEGARSAVGIPILGSLNAKSERGWVDYARAIEAAGASALELNLHFIPLDPNLSGGAVEERYASIVKTVKKAVRVPVAAKLGPYFSAMGHMASQLFAAGADGLVLFNRFYEPDIDPAELSVSPTLDLSTASELRVPLLWIGILAGRGGGSLAASTGVESADEVVKYLLAGADVVMTASALLRHGVGHMRALIEGLEAWLAARDLDGLDAIRGSLSRSEVADPTVFERANYLRA
jgi:dihydroorotate dehydrogenase (fumarate)